MTLQILTMLTDSIFPLLRMSEVEISNNNVKFDFDDILIQPAVTTNIGTRSIINSSYISPTYIGSHLPLITAPMDTVVSKENRDFFIQNNINICFPRGIETTKYYIAGKMCFVSYSLSEFIDKFIERSVHIEVGNPIHVCIDTANGHISNLILTIQLAKKRYGDNLIIMAGNVANPLTYLEYAEAGANFCRIAIGSGNACLTSQQTAIGYPVASLIKECYDIKIANNLKTKIVADGGMKKYADIIKAISLGADYVMIGNIFNKSLESCGDTYLFKIFKINPQSKFAKWLLKNKFPLYKKFRGMSTKEVQRKWNKKIIKTSEGISIMRPVEYTLESWTENFEHYLKSCMSYCDAIDLPAFIGKVKYNLITNNAFLRFKK